MRLVSGFAGWGILLIIIGVPIITLPNLELIAIAQSSDDLRSQQITEAIYLKQSGYDRLQKGDAQGAIGDLQKALELFRKWKATGGEREFPVLSHRFPAHSGFRGPLSRAHRPHP